MYQGFFGVDNLFIPTNACLVTNKHRCGKSTCRCARLGLLHESVVLKYRVNGKQKMKYVRQEDVEKVKRQLYQFKGLEILDRGDKYTLTIGRLFPSLSGPDIHVKVYEVFGQKKHVRQRQPAN